MAMTGHKSTEMVRRYIKEANLFKNNELNKIKIKAINMVKRHTKPTKEKKGGIVSKESFIHQSNVKNIDNKKSEKKAETKK